MSDHRAMKARHQFRRRFSLQPSFFKEDADEEELSLKVNSRSTSRVNEESSSSGSGVSDGARHKVVVLGAAKTGKSSLILRFLYGTFSPKYRRTVEEMHHADLGPGLSLDILDTAGAYEFPAMRALSIANGDAFILVYDVTDEASFNELRGLRAQILQTKPGAPIVVVANKLDLVAAENPGQESGTVHDYEDEALVTVDWEHGYVRTSAKDDVNVSQVFKELLVQAKVRYNLSPALRRRRQTLARHSISAGASPSSLVPSPQQIEHLQQLQQRHGKRNSCNIS